MMHDPIDPARWHPVGCDCAPCSDREDPGAARRLSSADRWSLQVITGLATGWAIVMLLDATGAGPTLARWLGVL